MKELKELQYICKLKEIPRSARVNNRMESTAEHVYSSQVLALYLIEKYNIDVNPAVVLRMLLFHDMTEIETGDYFLLDKKGRNDKSSTEAKASNIVKVKLPKELRDIFTQLWQEYENSKSPEAKFCQAVNKLDPMIHSIFQKKDWTDFNWTEKKDRAVRQKHIKKVPQLIPLYEKLIQYCKKHGYFIA
jgi:putative hydrolases of HD superfamily